MSSSQESGRPRFSLRASRLRWPEWLVAISALVLLVALFGISWFTFTSASGNQSVNGWHGMAHGHWLLLITIIAGLALFLLQAARPTPTIPVTMSVVVFILGLLSTIWLVVRVVLDPPGGRDAGGWVALVSAVVLTWAAWRSLSTEGIAPEDAPAEIPVLSEADIAAGRSAGHAQQPEPADRS
jgi:hypothetical protein